jgi:creatinine amidohydrolase/Fe(II)-dependent formamide hydrolase-like protein
MWLRAYGKGDAEAMDRLHRHPDQVTPAFPMAGILAPKGRRCSSRTRDNEVGVAMTSHDAVIVTTRVADGVAGRMVATEPPSRARPRILRTALIVATCLLAALARPGFTQPPETVFLEELTWTELRDLVRTGKTTIILPIGGTEQSGPHVALGKHNVRVKALAGRIAQRLGTALVGPVMAYVPEGALDPPSGHMRFPGTISVPDDAFRRVLESAVRSVRLHGFREVVLLGDHGSTQAGQRAVATRLNREWAGTPVRVHAVEEYYRASTAGVHALLKARGHRDEELGRHAGLADTALMLAVDPRLVRMGRWPGGAGRPDVDGVDGDPSRASAELGQPAIELIVTRTLDAIRQSIAHR